MKKIKNILVNKELKNYYIIIVIAFFICSLLLIGYPQGQDTVYHISRTVGTETALKQGQILPLISSNFVNGFGYSWNIFYPPLPNYLMMIIKLITHSYVKALNILIFLTVAISGMLMYNFMKKVTKSENIGLLGAILYMLAPYRLVDIYIRGALGEVMAFMFLPLVFHGLYNILECGGKRNYLLTIGAVGLLLSHNISTLLAVIVCIIYLIFNIKKIFNIKVVKILAINSIFIIGIVLFFYAPMLQNKNATNYAVFNELKNSGELLHDHSVYTYQLLFGKMQYEWSYSLDNPNSQNLDMCFAIGLTLMIPVIFTPFIYKKIDSGKRRMYLITVIMGIFFMILTTPIIPWNKLPSVIYFIQYPYRFLLIATFLLSIIAAINISKLTEKLEIKTIMLYTMITLIYITPLLQEAQILKGYNWKEFYEIEHLQENQRFSKFCAVYEYLPSKAYNNKNYIAKRGNEPILEDGNAEISNVSKVNLSIKFNIDNVTENSRIELPFIYYQGYKATVNDKKINITESDNGFIQIEIESGQRGVVNVKYEGTTLYKISMIISFISIIGLIIYIVICEKKYRNNV